jgi:hypothetical protein
VCHSRENPGFDSRCDPSNFSVDSVLVSTLTISGLHTASDRNEYQVISLRGKMRPACVAATMVRTCNEDGRGEETKADIRS